MQVVIRRVSLASLGRMGCLLGTVAAFLPSLICGLVGLALTSVVHRWLQSWQQASIPLLGKDVLSLDLVDLLGLEELMNVLEIVASASGPVLLLAVLILALVSGALLAAIIGVVGLAYNLVATATGGVIVEMATTGKQKDTE